MNYISALSYQNRGAQLALLTLLLAFIVILLGAYTRLTDAGLSCPDWPHCYGYLTAPHTESQISTAQARFPSTPVDTKKAWTEMIHRYAAGTEGLLILALVIFVLFSKKIAMLHTPALRALGFVLIGLLVIQVSLGMWTVTQQLKPVIVLSHLLTGITILASLWIAYLLLKPKQAQFCFNLSRRSKSALCTLLLIGIAFMFMQIALGGWMSANNAGLACIDFPYCNGSLIPPISWLNVHTDYMAMHMWHRLGALINALYLLSLSVILYYTLALRWFSVGLILLLSTQVCLGILNIMWLRPVWIALAHEGIAIVLLLTLMAALGKILKYAQSGTIR